MRIAWTPIVLLVTWSSVGRAAIPAIAVLPFKDLSGAKGAVGEAIRETVTADLKELPGLRVIERSAIDKVMEQQRDLVEIVAELKQVLCVKG